MRRVIVITGVVHGGVQLVVSLIGQGICLDKSVVASGDMMRLKAAHREAKL